MAQILSVMHYIPDHWKGKAHTLTVSYSNKYFSFVNELVLFNRFRTHDSWGGSLYLHISKTILDNISTFSELHSLFINQHTILIRNSLI